MSKSFTVAGIDIGNALVKVVIAENSRDLIGWKIVGVGQAPSSGLRKGVVVDMEETIKSIGEAVKKAETMSERKIRRAYVAVNGLHIRTQMSRGVVAVSRPDNEISQNDVDRVLEAASIVSLPANREIIHVIPKGYLVDGQEYVKNPLGMRGVRLEAEVLIIDGLSPYIRNLAKCLNANGIEVAEFVFSPRASGYSVLDRNQKEHGVISLDLGGGVSTFSFFQEGELVQAAVMPVGSRHITNDLAVALRTSMEVAEEVKLEHGTVTAVLASSKISGTKKDDLDLSDLMGEADFIIPRKNITKVIEARVGEVFDLLQGELKKISAVHLIPAGVVLSGGGAKLPGLLPFVKERLKLPVRIGGSRDLGGAMGSGFNDPALAVAVGLAFYGLEKESPGQGGEGLSFRRISLGNPWSKLRKAFGGLKDFMP